MNQLRPDTLIELDHGLFSATKVSWTTGQKTHTANLSPGKRQMRRVSGSFERKQIQGENFEERFFRRFRCASNQEICLNQLAEQTLSGFLQMARQQAQQHDIGQGRWRFRLPVRRRSATWVSQTSAVFGNGFDVLLVDPFFKSRMLLSCV